MPANAVTWLHIDILLVFSVLSWSFNSRLAAWISGATLGGPVIYHSIYTSVAPKLICVQCSCPELGVPLCFASSFFQLAILPLRFPPFVRSAWRESHLIQLACRLGHDSCGHECGKASAQVASAGQSSMLSLSSNPAPESNTPARNMV